MLCFWLCFFWKVDNQCSSQHKRDRFSLIIVMPKGMIKTLNYNVLMQARSICLQWGINSGTCLRIPELWFHWRNFLLMYVKLFYTRQGCCGTSQCNPSNRIMISTLFLYNPKSYVIFITLINMTYQSGGSVSPIYPFLR